MPARTSCRFETGRAFILRFWQRGVRPESSRHAGCSAVGTIYKAYTELPCWQAARRFKLAIYKCAAPDRSRCKRSVGGNYAVPVAKPPALIAEAFGRFNPLDSARVLTQAKPNCSKRRTISSTHATNLITDAVRVEYDEMAREVSTSRRLARIPPLRGSPTQERSGHAGGGAGGESESE